MDNPLLALDVKQPDIAGNYIEGQKQGEGLKASRLSALIQGYKAKADQRENDKQNALRQLYQTQGPGIANGDPNALAQLAQTDPGAAQTARASSNANATSQATLANLQLEHHLKTVQLGGSLAQAIINADPKDQPALYAQMNQQLEQLNPGSTANAPKEWNPDTLNAVKAMSARALTAEQQITNARAQDTQDRADAQAPFHPDGTPNKAVQDYNISLKTAAPIINVQGRQDLATTNNAVKEDIANKGNATRLQVAGMGGGSSGTAGGTVPGLVGHPEIDAKADGYSTAPVGQTQLTQAAIDQKALSYVTSGTLPPQGRTGVAGIQNAAISNRMAEMGQGANLAVNKTELKSLSGSLSTQQKYLDTTQRAFNTANDTLAALQTYMAKNNINPSEFPDYNSFNNWMKSRGLDPGAAGGYRAQITTLRAEYSQVLAKGGVRSVETDREAAKLIPDNLAPSQLAEVADQIKIDGNNVVNDAQNQVGKVTRQINGLIKPRTATGQPQTTNAPPANGGWGNFRVAP